MRRDEMCEILIDDDMRKEKKKGKERKGKERKGKERKGKRKWKGKGSRGQKHLYRLVMPPGTNIHICTGYVTRYKCSTSFVPDGLYWLDTGTNERFSSIV
jgi:hypothetical protein